jgi:hypothetical protein
MKSKFHFLICSSVLFFARCKKNETAPPQNTAAQNIAMIKGDWIEDSLANSDGYTSRTAITIQPSILRIDTSLHYAYWQNIGTSSAYDTGQFVLSGNTKLLCYSLGGDHSLAGYGAVLIISVSATKLVLNAPSTSFNDITFYYHR